MLLEFKAENYRSFKDEFTFSMIPAQKQKDLSYSILKNKIGGKTYKGLCSAVIYGPNASGKSNIIGAMGTLSSIVSRGHVRNDNKETNNPNMAAFQLQIVPNNLVEKKVPVKFSVKFIEENMLFHYELKIDLGNFMEENAKRRILEENLYINEKLIFARARKVVLGDEFMLKKFIDPVLLSDDKVLNYLNAPPADEELYLTNGFKTIFGNKLYTVIKNWFERKLLVIYDSNMFYSVIAPIKPQKNRILIFEDMNNLAKHLGLNSNKIGYAFDESGEDPKMCSLFGNMAVNARAIESYGTIRFLNMFPALVEALQNGSTLVVDELDCSLHPMVVMSIINIFHNNEINKNNAQLIFNTHNPIFLNKNLFRRDEIKFVERDNDGFSSHYSLSDFGTAGNNRARKTSDYMKNYFVSRYGAIREIDFSPFVKEAMNSKRKKSEIGRIVQKNDKKGE